MEKLCTSCNLVLDTSNFGIRKASKDGLAYTCISCRKKYRCSTKEHRKQYGLNYFSKEENRKSRVINNKKFYANNPSYFAEWRKKHYSLEANKIKRLDRQRFWLAENREHVGQYNRIRRDLVSLMDCNYTIEDYNYTKQLFRNCCFKCNSITNVCVDHHMPLSKGFGLSRVNAVLLCKNCNSNKKDKHPLNYYSNEEIEKLSSLGIKTLL